MYICNIQIVKGKILKLSNEISKFTKSIVNIIFVYIEIFIVVSG